MNSLPDLLLVGAIVVAAVWYAVRSLGPRRWRARRGTAQTGACGGCDGCGSATPGAASGAAETRVPLTAIGHRQVPRTTSQNPP